MIMGLTGMVRSGKDSFADYLASEYGFAKLNMSDVLKEELVKEGKEPTKENMSILGDRWRKEFGMDIVMRRTLENAKKQEKVVICGIRSLEEIDFIRRNAVDFVLIAVVADAKTRFARRSESDEQDFGGFIARDNRDIKNKGLDKAIACADYTIENNFSSLEDFYKAINALLAKQPPLLCILTSKSIKI
ncbi:AAA family ATPase [archaeon]|nr:AAA family ATPase [archaeon]